MCKLQYHAIKVAHGRYTHIYIKILTDYYTKSTIAADESVILETYKK